MTIKIQSNTWSQPQINFASIVSGFTLTNQWPIKVAINFPARDNISALSFNINNSRWLPEDRDVLNKFACIKSDTDKRKGTSFSRQILDSVCCYRPQNAIISYGRSCLKTGNWCYINASQASGLPVRNLQTCISLVLLVQLALILLVLLVIISYWYY